MKIIANKSHDLIYQKVLWNRIFNFQQLDNKNEEKIHKKDCF